MNINRKLCSNLLSYYVNSVLYKHMLERADYSILATIRFFFLRQGIFNKTFAENELVFFFLKDCRKNVTMANCGAMWGTGLGACKSRDVGTRG